jgi:hypothetical protein
VVVEKLVRSPVDKERIRDSRWNSLCRCLHINLSFVRNGQVLWRNDGVVVVVVVVVVMNGESPAAFSQMEMAVRCPRFSSQVIFRRHQATFLVKST